MSLSSAVASLATRVATEFNTLRGEISERARDALGSALVAGSGITITPNDGADTITIAATGAGGSSTKISDLAAATTLTDDDLLVVVDGTTTKKITAANAFGSRLKLSADVVNNNATANTLADTGLEFAVASGTTYTFRALVAYSSAATTTGARFVTDGPTMTTIGVAGRWTLTATTGTLSYGGLNTPSASNATSLTSGNLAILEGIVVPSASGTVKICFASEVASSAVTVKAGSFIEWRTI